MSVRASYLVPGDDKMGKSESEDQARTVGRQSTEMEHRTTGEIEA